MSRCPFLSLLLISALFASGSPGAFAAPATPSSYTLQIPTPARLTSADLSRAFPRVKIRPMFSDGERAGLIRLGSPLVAATLILGPIDPLEAAAFEESFRQKFPTLDLERNETIPFFRDRPMFTVADATPISAPTPPAADAPSGPDPLRSQQWALKNTGQEVRIDLDDLRTGALASVPGEDVDLPSDAETGPLKEVTVAVLDTGLDVGHADLRATVKSKPEECEALGKYLDCKVELLADADAEKKCLARIEGKFDRDGNGYPMDCVGWSVTSSLSADPASPLSKVLGTPEMDDLLGHGTHVAGIIAAKRDNGIGVSGIAPNARILPIRVIDTPPTAPIRPQDSDAPDPAEDKLKLGNSSVELIARGMLYAILQDAKVINLSLGWPATLNSRIFGDLVRIAQSRGIAVVAAAGNDSTDSLVLPCSFPGVICVGASGPDGNRAKYSNRGPGVDLLAPGTSILSTYPLALRAHFFTDLGGYEIMSGTSMSAPMVAGAMAILLGKGYSVDESLARMLASARVTGGDAPIGQNRRLDLAAAIRETPRPYLHVTERAPIRVTWSHLGQHLAGAFHVKNLWTGATKCSITYRLTSSESTVSDASLNESLSVSAPDSNCGVWKAREERAIPFAIEVRDLHAERDFILTTTVNLVGDNGKPYVQTLQSSVRIVPTPDVSAEALKISTYAVEGGPAGRGLFIRTVGSADAPSTSAKPEYVTAALAQDQSIGFQLLTSRKTANYVYSQPPQKLDDRSWQFLSAQRYWSEEAHATRIALIFRQKIDALTLTKMRFDLFDEDLRTPIRSIVYDGAYAPLPENFRWTTFDGKDAMLFVAAGKQPPSDNAWDQVLDLSIFLRCYVLDSSGALHWIQVDRNDPQTRIVDVLPYLPEDTSQSGEQALLVINGKDYQVNYSIGHFRDGKVVRLDPFTITPYRNLSTLAPSPVVSEAGLIAGSARSSIIGRGVLRTTVLVRTGYGSMENDDFRFAPLDPLDGVSNLVGAFRLNGRKSFFAQTNWDLQFHEFTYGRARGEEASSGASEGAAGRQAVVKTTLARFSFLPKLISQRAFFPILVQNESAKEPAVLAADFASDAFNLSTILPKRDSSGGVTGLSRPAILSFESSESGCSFIGNPTWDAVTGVFRMNSFCGSSIRSMVLGIPPQQE